MSATIKQIDKKKTLASKLRFNGFSGGWKNRKLEEVVKIGRGKSKHRPRNASFLYGGKYPFVQTGDIKAADLYLTKYTQTYSEEGLKQSKLWNEDTLCITIAANIAETAILKIKACFPDSIIGLIPKEDKTIVLFVKYLFDKFKIEIQNLSQGIAQDNLNQEKLSKIEFHFPTLLEQQKIASFLSAIDEKIQQLTRKKELLEQYKKGVMQQLFPSAGSGQSSGKLRFKDRNGKVYPKWEDRRLGDVCTFFSGGTPTSTNRNFYSGSIPFIGSGNIYDSEVFSFISEEALNSSSSKMVEKGDLLYALYGANSGEVAISKIRGAINQAILCIRSEECIEYLYYALLLDKDKIVAKYLQGGQGNLSANIIKRLKYKLPSIEEQQKIANYLSSIDNKIESVNNQISQTQIFKKGLLQQMFV